MKVLKQRTELAVSSKTGSNRVREMIENKSTVTPCKCSTHMVTLGGEKKTKKKTFLSLFPTQVLNFSLNASYMKWYLGFYFQWPEQSEFLC